MGPSVLVASVSRWRRVALAALAGGGLLIAAVVHEREGEPAAPRRTACGGRPHHGHHGPHGPGPRGHGPHGHGPHGHGRMHGPPVVATDECRAALATWSEARRDRDLDDAPSLERERALDACLHPRR